MAKPFKKEDNRNAIQNLSHDIGVKLAYDGEKLCVAPQPLGEIRDHKSMYASNEGDITVSKSYGDNNCNFAFLGTSRLQIWQEATGL